LNNYLRKWFFKEPWFERFFETLFEGSLKNYLKKWFFKEPWFLWNQKWFFHGITLRKPFPFFCVG